MEFETFCSAETLESMSLVSNPSRQMLSQKPASGFLIPLKFESIQMKLYVKTPALTSRAKLNKVVFANISLERTVHLCCRVLVFQSWRGWCHFNLKWKLKINL